MQICSLSHKSNNKNPITNLKSIIDKIVALLMGVFSNLRGPKIGSTHEELPVANVSSSSSSTSSFKRKVSTFLPICVALVIIIEIGFLCRLDNASLVDTLTHFFTKSSPDLKVGSGMEKCQEWLERVDSVTYSRDFSKNPIFIAGGNKVCRRIICLSSNYVSNFSG